MGTNFLTCIGTAAARHSASTCGQTGLLGGGPHWAVIAVMLGVAIFGWLISRSC